MYFCHSSGIWRDYPELVPGVLFAEPITRDASVSPQLAKFYAVAESRLATNSEGELPEIQAWRRVFSRMGLKPTQYRCASESLLRRFRKEKSLPRIHPLIDFCNAISLGFAIPVAVFDTAKITEYSEVRYATGSEIYLAFSGDEEHPEPGEVIFADKVGRAHARRWTNRQSRYSGSGATPRLCLRPDPLRPHGCLMDPRITSIRLKRPLALPGPPRFVRSGKGSVAARPGPQHHLGAEAAGDVRGAVGRGRVNNNHEPIDMAIHRRQAGWQSGLRVLDNHAQADGRHGEPSGGPRSRRSAGRGDGHGGGGSSS
jgi:DNA/RNA-binding domain of Phe-tRNA-synthetase-like protein